MNRDPYCKLCLISVKVKGEGLKDRTFCSKRCKDWFEEWLMIPSTTKPSAYGYWLQRTGGVR